MKLDDREVQKIIDHIHMKWGKKAQCPKCYQSSDLLFDKSKIRVFALSEYHQGTMVVGGDQIQIPVVPIFCKNCGHVELLNVNVIEEAQKEKPKEDPS